MELYKYRLYLNHNQTDEQAYIKTNKRTTSPEFFAEAYRRLHCIQIPGLPQRTDKVTVTEYELINENDKLEIGEIPYILHQYPDITFYDKPVEINDVTIKVLNPDQSVYLQKTLRVPIDTENGIDERRLKFILAEAIRQRILKFLKLTEQDTQDISLYEILRAPATYLAKYEMKVFKTIYKENPVLIINKDETVGMWETWP